MWQKENRWTFACKTRIKLWMECLLAGRKLKSAARKKNCADFKSLFHTWSLWLYLTDVPQVLCQLNNMWHQDIDKSSSHHTTFSQSHETLGHQSLHWELTAETRHIRLTSDSSTTSQIISQTNIQTTTKIQSERGRASKPQCYKHTEHVMFLGSQCMKVSVNIPSKWTVQDVVFLAYSTNSQEYCSLK